MKFTDDWTLYQKYSDQVEHNFLLVIGLSAHTVGCVRLSKEDIEIKIVNLRKLLQEDVSNPNCAKLEFKFFNI